MISPAPTPADCPRHVSRREFLAAGMAAWGALQTPGRTAEPVGIIDTHTHFYDPSRPQGVPWPKPDTKLLYRRVRPAEYRALAAPHGVIGTVVVEASPWVEDNQWLLDLAKDEPFIVGIVGNLDPLDARFAPNLARFAKDPLFRGIRISGATLAKRGQEPEFVANLRRLAEANLSLDLNGGDYLAQVPALATAIPALRIIIDHVGGAGDPARLSAKWSGGMRTAAAAPNVYCKVSGLPEQSGRPPGEASTRPEDYQPILETVWEAFGAERLVFGSNWPVSDRGTAFANVLGIVRPFFAKKGQEAEARYLQGNAARFYQWPKRT